MYTLPDVHVMLMNDRQLQEELYMYMYVTVHMHVYVLYFTPNQRVRRKAGGNVGANYKRGGHIWAGNAGQRTCTMIMS